MNNEDTIATPTISEDSCELDLTGMDIVQEKYNARIERKRQHRKKLIKKIGIMSLILAMSLVGVITYNVAPKKDKETKASTETVETAQGSTVKFPVVHNVPDFHFPFEELTLSTAKNFNTSLPLVTDLKSNTISLEPDITKENEVKEEEDKKVEADKSDETQLSDAAEEIVETEEKENVTINEEPEAVATETATTRFPWPSDSEMLESEKVVWAECGACDEDTQQAVAYSIFKWAEIEGKSVHDIINQRGLYSVVKGGVVYSNGVPVSRELAERCRPAVEKAIREGSGKVGQMLTDKAISLGLDPELYAGNGPIYFYSSNLRGSEAAKRESISVKVLADRVWFYSYWNK